MRAFVCTACALALGCSQPQLTEILIVVDTDMPVPSQLSTVRYRVRSPQGEEQQALTSFAAGEPRPAVLALVHRGGPLGPFLVEVSGERAPGEVVRQRSARVSFQTGRALELRMDLLARCGDVVCPTDETCGESGCRPIAIDPAELVGWTRASGLDASTPDGGAATTCALDSDCDDSVACTNDECRSGDCAHVADDSLCASDAVACTIESCDATRGCVSIADTSQCDDGVACTVDVCDPAIGCTSAPDDARCDDGVACTTDRCDATIGCASIADDAACDDHVACTVDACDVTLGCVSTPDDAACDDAVGCTADACDPVSGCGSTSTHALCPAGQYCAATAGSGCAVGPTFTDVYAMITAACGTCHTTSADGGLDMSTQAVAWTNLVGAAATCGANTRVVPRDASSSLLWRKVARTDLCGARMPPAGMPLSTANVDLVARWIESGALDD